MFFEADSPVAPCVDHVYAAQTPGYVIRYNQREMCPEESEFRIPDDLSWDESVPNDHFISDPLII